MTCVVGLVSDGAVYLGSDSVSSDGHRKWTRRDPKVMLVGGGSGEHKMAAGICGSWRLRDVLQWEMSIEAPRAGVEVEKWVRTDFVSELRSKMKKAGALQVSHDVETLGHADFLLAAGDQLFFVGADLQIGFCEEWGDAIGSGLDIARGVLYDRRDQEEPMPKLLAALRAAAALITTVRGPFTIHRFAGGELTRVHEGD
jgi:hypothetical protein